uniref:Coat protein n=1 Tax=Mint virus X TaxID=301865 RepID=Q5BQD5_9VIRU|nr:coat protein [Mint virus X]
MTNPTDDAAAAAAAAAASAAKGKETALDSLGPPDPQFLKDFSYVVATDSVATRGMVEAIRGKWERLGVPAASFFGAALQLALACSDSHASSLTVLVGECAAAPSVGLRDLAASVKTICQLRHFCRFYAKFVWNCRVTHDLPPASWAAQGFPFEARFAAFDFFDGVTNSAALEPAQGLIRPPTEIELKAAHTGKFVALATSGTSSLTLSNHAAVTHGRAETARPTILPP